MGRLFTRMKGGWLTAALLALLIAVGAIQAVNPHSYLAEAIARIGETASGPDATLTDITGIDQLRSSFNRDSGSPRLILLLSPT